MQFKLLSYISPKGFLTFFFLFSETIYKGIWWGQGVVLEFHLDLTVDFTSK